MAEHWVGPSLRTSPRRWERHTPTATGKPHRPIPGRGAQPFLPRRARAVLRLTHTTLRDIHFLSRYVAHLSLLVLTVVVGKFYSTDVVATLQALQPRTSSPVSTSAVPAPFVLTPYHEHENAALTWDALPQSVIPERPAAARTTPTLYEVREGDNPSIIAERFGLQPSTIVWSNTAGAESGLLQIGQKLVIPPTDGILHTVATGDTLSAIASKYTAEMATILAFTGNSISDASAPLVVGQYVMVPGGTYPYEPPPAPAPAPAAVASTSSTTPRPPATQSTGSSTPIAAVGCCRWPVSGRITTQPSGYHMALDIATSLGTPIVAGDGGKVIAAGWDNTGYGYRVIIDHGNGLRTLYAHMSSYSVDVGDWVAKGNMIGRIGSTGNSTGPHLHFEVRRGNARQNPWNYLP